MHILLSGGTGFIGSQLCKYFAALDYRVTVLCRSQPHPASDYVYAYIHDLRDTHAAYDIIINLAGEPLHRRRWNRHVKNTIYNSRIDTTQNIIDYIQYASIKPRVFLNASAVGYYEGSSTTLYTEDMVSTATDFTQLLCRDWESVASQANVWGVRVCLLRMGIVLGKNGGALQTMLLPFRWGLGAQLGDGQQWMSWIHGDDLLYAIHHILHNPRLQGPIHLTAPHPVQNVEFSKALAHVLHQPCWIRLPRSLVRLLFGEMAGPLLLASSRVLPEKLLQAGFVFRYTDVHAALQNILGE